jgi:thioredoxin 2
MHLVCPACGAKNRVAVDQLDHEVRCGRCRQDLMAREPVALGDAQLPGFLQGTELPVVVDFWAGWCGPCKMMAPHFAQVARQMPRVRFVKLDTEASPRAAQQYAIRSIPTLILFHNGREIQRQSGAMSAQDLQRWIERALMAVKTA